MFKNLGTIEVIIVSFVLLVLFGSKKLNEVARGLGESSKEFKKVKKEYNKTFSGNLFEEEKSETEGKKSEKEE